MASRRKEVVTLGAIRKRGKQYAIRYYDATGKRRWETIGPNLQEARQVLADRMWERRNGKYRLSRPKITVAVFVTKWQGDYLAVQQQLGRLKPSTANSYQSNLANHILPFFGAMSLRDVTLPHVREFIKTLLGKQLAAKTIGNVILILKQMFKHAVQWGTSIQTRCSTSSCRAARRRRWTSSRRQRSDACSRCSRSRSRRCSSRPS